MKESREQLHARIRSAGFEPFPYPEGSPESTTNPAQVVYPGESNFDRSQWLTVNEAEMIVDKSDSTINRWEQVGHIINCNRPRRGAERHEASHFILKSDFLRYWNYVRLRDTAYVDSQLLEAVTGGQDQLSSQLAEHPRLEERVEVGQMNGSHSVPTRRQSLSLEAEFARAIQPFMDRVNHQRRRQTAVFWTLIGVVSASVIGTVGYLTGRVEVLRSEQKAALAGFLAAKGEFLSALGKNQEDLKKLLESQPRSLYVIEKMKPAEESR